MKKLSIFLFFLLSLLSNVIVAYTSGHEKIVTDTAKPALKNILDWSGSKELVRPVNSMVFYKSKLYYSTRNGIFILDTKNKKPIPVAGGLDINVPNYNVFTKLVVHKNNLYAANLFNGIYQFNDKNEKWVALKKGLTDSSFFDLISCNGILYAPSHDNGLFEFNDNDATWTVVKGNNVKLLCKGGCIDSILWVGNMANELFRLNPKTNEIKRILQFRDADKYENSVIGVGITGLEYVNDTIFAGCHVNGIFKSTDNGLTWSKKPIKFVVGVMYKWQGMIFISDYWGYKDGLFLFSTATDEFQKMELGLADQKILDVQCINGVFYITNLDGIWAISSVDFLKYYVPKN